MFRFLLFLMVGLFGFVKAFGTHIRAGEITAIQVSGTQFEFTFTGYRDSEGEVLFGGGIFDFGDGTIAVTPSDRIRWNVTDLGDGIERWEFKISKTYSAAANYLVSYTEENRNKDIQNISGSVDTPFHVETLIIIDNLYPNDSPYFTVPPVDQAAVGAIFEHSPRAFDLDGDSLSYSLVTPQQGSNVEVNGYEQLNNSRFYDDPENGNSAGNGPPTMSIDPVTGLLTWDAPGGATIPDLECREWNVAIRVQEWRKISGEYLPLGYVVRDMQIIVCDFENDPPELEIPDDTCVVAGDIAVGKVTGTDPNGDPVRLEAFGGPFQLVPTATFSPDPPVFQPLPATLEFEWETVCGFVQSNPYQIEFKATDLPNIPEVPTATGQSNFETWEITVVGPAPQGLVVDASGAAMNLSWDPYECSNAERMEVWRRVGEFELDTTCEPGVPANSGYKLIQTLDIGDTDFVDTNDGLGLSPGSKYCYRLVATFPTPRGGLSIASDEVCDSLLIDLPVITNVNVRSTGEEDGEIQVSWSPPLEIDPGEFPPSYTYDVLRTEGMGPGGEFTFLSTTADTTFLDQGLNTEELTYSYRILLRSQGNPVDTSQQASTVRLVSTPLLGKISLSWSAEVPWSNAVQSFPDHYIYRDRVLSDFPDSLVLIDTVNVTSDGFSYLDDGIEPDEALGIAGEEELDDQIEYRYLVTTQGSYDNVLLPEPLINNSQIISVQPNDSIPPCTPVNFSFSSNSSFTCETQFVCGSNVLFENVIQWDIDESGECGDDIEFYRIYAAETGDLSSFQPLTETTFTEFSHRNLASLALCYYVEAVDRSGNPSIISEVICNDNCPQYRLPNVFTPNGDSFNDTFRAIEREGECTRFVESVVLTIVNRAGSEVFSYNSNEIENSVDNVAWDGSTNGGVDAPAGIYYYAAEVRFATLNPEDSNQVIKGWVQLIR